LVCRSAIQSQARRDDVLLPDVDKRQYQAEATVSWIVTGYWALTLVLVWWTPWVEIAWFLTIAVGTAGRFVSRRPVSGTGNEQAEERGKQPPRRPSAD
jgi:hypothetical protein